MTKVVYVGIICAAICMPPNVGRALEAAGATCDKSAAATERLPQQIVPASEGAFVKKSPRIILNAAFDIVFDRNLFDQVVGVDRRGNLKTRCGDSLELSLEQREPYLVRHPHVKGDMEPLVNGRAADLVYVKSIDNERSSIIFADKDSAKQIELAEIEGHLIGTFALMSLDAPLLNVLVYTKLANGHMVAYSVSISS